MVAKNNEKHDYKSIKHPVSTAFRTLYCQILCLITSHETFNLMLYTNHGGDIVSGSFTFEMDRAVAWKLIPCR